MEITAETEIERSREASFAALSDFEALAKLGKSIGLSVARLPAEGGAQAWHVAGVIKGQKIDAEVVLSDYRPHEVLGFATAMAGLSADLSFTLTDAEAGCCAVATTLTATPSSMGMRLILQPLKLRKGKIAAALSKHLKSYVEAQAEAG